MPSFVAPVRKGGSSQTSETSKGSEEKFDCSVILERKEITKKIDETKKESPFKSCLQTLESEQSKDGSDCDSITSSGQLLPLINPINTISIEENVSTIGNNGENSKNNDVKKSEKNGGKNKNVLDDAVSANVGNKENQVDVKKPKDKKFNKPENIDNVVSKCVAKNGDVLSQNWTVSSSQGPPDNEDTEVTLSQVSNFSSVFTNMILSQAPKNYSHKQRLQWLQERREVGLWVMCNKPDCKKWRYLPHIHDPTNLPDLWYCYMNPDGRANDCAKKEQKLKVHEEEDCIHGQYSAGSLVWARLQGYPWWPAIVDDDPDTEQFYWLDGFSDIPTYYHVTFFDSEKVSRAWITPENLKAMVVQGEFNHVTNNKTPTIFERRLKCAIKQAKNAMDMSTGERLKKFSFIARYKGTINTPKGEKKLKKTTKRMIEHSSTSESSDSDTETEIPNFRRNKKFKSTLTKILDTDMADSTLVSLEGLITMNSEAKNTLETNVGSNMFNTSTEIPIQPRIIKTQVEHLNENHIIYETESNEEEIQMQAIESSTQNLNLDAVVPCTQLDVENLTEDATEYTY